MESLIEEKLAYFQKRKLMLPKLEAELAQVSNESQRKKLQEEIQDIKTGKSEVEYLLTVAPLIKEYTAISTKPEPAMNTLPAEGIDKLVEHESTQCRGKVYRKYKVLVEGDYNYMDIGESEKSVCDEDTCIACGGTVFRSREGRTCEECGLMYPEHIHDGDVVLTYEQRINDVTPIYTYRRQNHFGEWLSRLTAREMTNVPENVLDAVKSELKKARITDPKDIDQKKVKFYLKKLKLSKYYEHAAQITQRLAGIQPPTFSPALESKLRQMFEEIQKPFEMFRPPDRSNFLSYGYVLYQSCRLLGEDQYLPYLPLLKSFSKLHQQDMIWKNICKFLKWEFIPTV